MKFRRRNFMDLFFMIVGGGAFIIAIKWPLKTALFPVVISVPVFCMALADLLLNIFETEGSGSKQSAMDFELSEGVDKALALRRTLSAFAWIIIFFLLILCFGFIIAVPLFVFSYLKIQAREKWGISIILSCLAWAFLYGLFVKVLDIPFQSGWLLQ
ncbi:tripartite tricarboxylate transporter TctB family protein [Thermodesulfobacteriota bacterium]